MASGSLPPAPNLTYPEDCVQSLVNSWWQQDGQQNICRGRLVWVFVPHVEVETWTLAPLGRKEATSHSTINFRLEVLKVGQAPKRPTLPVAALPDHPGEIYAVYRSKRRPALVIGTGGSIVPDALRSGGARWSTAQTAMVAPFYGAVASEKRGGFPPELLTRIRHCEYPQFLWDMPPAKNQVEESVLVLSRIQPIGLHHNSIESTPFKLSDDALFLLDEWIGWLLTGTMEESGLLPDIQRTLADSQKKSVSP